MIGRVHSNFWAFRFDVNFSKQAATKLDIILEEFSTWLLRHSARNQ